MLKKEQGILKIIISLMLVILVSSSCQKAPVVQTKSIWKPYSKEAIANSIAAHKPVVIDFFAEWCPMCHELDHYVFSKPEVQTKLSQFTTLRMDATDQDNPDIQKILQDYNVDGLPTVVFLDKNGNEINNSRIVGYASPQEFMQLLAMLEGSK